MISDQQILEAYQAGLTRRELARITGRSPRAVRRLIDKAHARKDPLIRLVSNCELVERGSLHRNAGGLRVR